MEKAFRQSSDMADNPAIVKMISDAKTARHSAQRPQDYHRSTEEDYFQLLNFSLELLITSFKTFAGNIQQHVI